MNWTALPPVRRPVPLTRTRSGDARQTLQAVFNNRQVLLLGSGTEALAAALVACKRRRGALQSEAILPAYGCPDLVAAALQAGVQPRLVDVARDGWGYDLQALRLALTERTVAVVAVNLLGIGDDKSALAQAVSATNASLVQDSAQYLPRAEQSWPGEYVILSFGRGKPLNLLGGGALLAAPELLSETPPISGETGGRHRITSGPVAAVVFNIATHPAIYRWLERMPGAGVGITRYKPLTEIRRLPQAAWNRVSVAFEEYSENASYDATVWNSVLPTWEKFEIQPLRAARDPASCAELLRLPLLARDRAARDHIVAGLNRRGLGASPMYGAALNAIEGLPSEVAQQGPFPNAAALGDRLFTLPTHSYVTQRVVDSADRCIRESQRVALG